ncbi:hypothetical protein ACNSOS_11530 [Aliarcobacter vitoriensis]|uniref:hypothetical protein n=1 Tax=Aliarcobacter vitoriensis TaxID=2011099 RepID=UPI000DEAC5CD|nr:hypothetical protein CRU92_12240 [Arcobacter sp. FW59]
MINTEKVTFNLPIELKAKVNELKEDLQTSLSSIYIEAISEYVKKQEEKKWIKGFELASKDAQYQKLCEEFGNSDDGGLYEY